MKNYNIVIIFIICSLSALSQTRKRVLIRNSEILVDGGTLVMPRTLPRSNDSIEYKYYFAPNDTARMLVIGSSRSSLKNSICFYKQLFFYKIDDANSIYEWIPDMLAIKFDKSLEKNMEVLKFVDGMQVNKLEELEIIWENQW